MELVVKRFDELSVKELYAVLEARVAVFVVEQHCPYQEIDGQDLFSYHVFLHDNAEILAYARVIDAQPGSEAAAIGQVAIGRVLTAATQRGAGRGKAVMQEAIRVAKELMHAKSIHIEAQVYAKGFYEKLGFVQTSEPFLIDDIPHMDMLLALE
jgi:ElaA protein